MGLQHISNLPATDWEAGHVDGQDLSRYSIANRKRPLCQRVLNGAFLLTGMQRAIIGTLLASQDTMDRRPNTFELFGADFMICENFYPWLIEINSSPDLGNTTSVTARMCPQCLEDVVKGEWTVGG